jgi:hypothetical protein
MSGEAIRRQRVDEDTDMGFLGHMTNQAGDKPERNLNDPKRRETGPERSLGQSSARKEQKERRRNQEDRK